MDLVHLALQCSSSQPNPDWVRARVLAITILLRRPKQSIDTAFRRLSSAPQTCAGRTGSRILVGKRRHERARNSCGPQGCRTSATETVGHSARFSGRSRRLRWRRLAEPPASAPTRHLRAFGPSRREGVVQAVPQAGLRSSEHYPDQDQSSRREDWLEHPEQGVDPIYGLSPVSSTRSQFWLSSAEFTTHSSSNHRILASPRA